MTFLLIHTNIHFCNSTLTPNLEVHTNMIIITCANATKNNWLSVCPSIDDCSSAVPFMTFLYAWNAARTPPLSAIFSPSVSSPLTLVCKHIQPCSNPNLHACMLRSPYFVLLQGVVIILVHQALSTLIKPSYGFILPPLGTVAIFIKLPTFV